MSILDIDEKFEGISHDYLISKGFTEDLWGSMKNRTIDPDGSKMYSLMLYITDKYNFTKYFGEVFYFPPTFKRYVNFDNKIAHDKAANHVVVALQNQSRLRDDHFIYDVKEFNVSNSFDRDLGSSYFSDLKREILQTLNHGVHE